MFTRRSFLGLLVAALGTLAFGAADASAQSARFYVVNNGNGALYEVRDGSGTGGRCVHQPHGVAGVNVAGYTDRASRGEHVLVLIQGSGRADYVGFRSDNNVVNVRANHVYLPAWTFGRVWLSPHVDNVYVSAKMPGYPEYRRRLPIGTRP